MKATQEYYNGEFTEKWLTKTTLRVMYNSERFRVARQLLERSPGKT
jgi:hypothetical protein